MEDLNARGRVIKTAKDEDRVKAMAGAFMTSKLEIGELTGLKPQEIERRKRLAVANDGIANCYTEADALSLPVKKTTLTSC